MIGNGRVVEPGQDAWLKILLAFSHIMRVQMLPRKIPPLPRSYVKNEVNYMRSYASVDRKQIFGTEELNEFYMTKIKKLCEDQIMRLTSKRDSSITLPLTRWVN